MKKELNNYWLQKLLLECNPYVKRGPRLRIFIKNNLFLITVTVNSQGMRV